MTRRCIPAVAFLLAGRSAHALDGELVRYAAASRWHSLLTMDRI